MSKELKILTALNTRMDLPEKERQQYWSLLKGFEGELQFDRRIASLETENLVLNDLLLEVSGSVFQIDSLVIFQDTVYLFEVKNYEGDYYYEDEKLRTITDKEVKDPLLQLKRSESLLRQLLNTLGYNFSIKAYVIFVHPEFTLFQAPKDEPIILSTQMNRFMKKLNNIKSKISVRNTKLAEKLMSLHLPESPMERNHEYEYGMLRKGVFCVGCGGVANVYHQPKLLCTSCGKSEHIEAAILRNVDEFRLLFPNEKITTNLIYDWCGGSISKRTIQRYLMKNFKVKGVKNWTYYE
ncbi:nuclease-related domain-containing protein [Bacillus sp. JJ1609]|uniref:nuclease-related domain-containing protein n=1 Tax=Bacillus sp. JJ1609 TaxID=3122977 RepID=UPI002FFF9162